MMLTGQPVVSGGPLKGRIVDVDVDGIVDDHANDNVDVNVNVNELDAPGQ
jgi:hypothetical protein